jgi:hypothetical protein
MDQISTYVVKAKRGTVTFTKCDAEGVSMFPSTAEISLLHLHMSERV